MQTYATISRLISQACLALPALLLITWSATAPAANPPAAHILCRLEPKRHAPNDCPGVRRRAGRGCGRYFRNTATFPASVQQYSKDGKTLSVALYRMKDSSGAYGLYSFLRSPGMAHAPISRITPACPIARALILDGVTVVEIIRDIGLDLSRDQSRISKSLVDALGPAAADSPYPDLFKRLPLRGFQARNRPLHSRSRGAPGFGSDCRWRLGRLRQWRRSGDRPISLQRNENHTATLIVIDYPTPQVASKMLKEWAGKFNLDAQDADSRRPTIFASRKLTIVGVVSGRSQCN